MSTLIPSLILLAALFARGWRLRRTSRALVFSALGLLWLGGSGLPSRWILDRIQINERLLSPRWGARNAIVLLGWGLVKWPSGEVTVDIRGASRVREAARLYFDCRAKGRACTILASSGDPTHQGRTEADAMAEDLRNARVPAADILLEDRSDNTFQNARYSSEILARGTFDHVVLVTSGFHLKRSLLYFSHFSDVPLAAAPADHFSPSLSWVPRAVNFDTLDLALTEVIGIWRFGVYNALGWNPPAPRSSAADPHD